MSDHENDAEIENGHLTSTTDGESSDEENPSPSNDGDFDTDLPTVHKYLGKLNSVSGFTIYDDGEIINILGIYTKTLVFPGFTLPLVMNDQQEITIMQYFMNQKRLFVLLSGDFAYDGIFNYGVTMEIFETELRNRVLHIKAKGRQRCKLVQDREIRHLSDNMKEVKVRILGEHDISTPFCDTQMLTLKHRRPLTCSKFSDTLKNYKYRKYHSTQYPLPIWVYDRNETSYFVKMIREELAGYCGEYIPEDPLQLSYWFVQNYQLTHGERLRILKLDTVIERLKLEYTYLKLERNMNCYNCGVHLTDPSKVFAMSKDGIQSNYVNPGGHVYETVTVMSAENCQLVGNPSKQFSWFPGYAWTVVICRHCSNHLGWRFTSEVLRPKEFYGLAKIGFKVVISNEP